MVSTNKVWSGVTDYFSGKCSQSDLLASPPQQVHFIEYEYDDDDVNHDNADKTLTMMTTIICRSKFVRDGGSDEWVGYVGHHNQGQGDPDGSQRRAEGHHHRHHHYHHPRPSSSITHHVYISSSSVIFNKECLINRVTHDLWRKCSSALFRLVIRVLMSCVVKFCVFSQGCLSVSCSDPLIHIFPFF